MKWFRKMYVWAMNAKLFMAMYFTALTLLMALLVVLTGGQSLPLLTLVELLALSIAIALLQSLLLSDSVDYSHGVFFGRSVLWLVLSVGLTLAASLLLGWFAGYPAWCPYVLAALMFCGLTAMLFGIKFEREADTVRLNSDLERYKAKG